MKINRKQLRKLIMEALLNEQNVPEPSNVNNWTHSDSNGIKQFMYNFKGLRNKFKYQNTQLGTSDIKENLKFIIIRDEPGKELYIETESEPAGEYFEYSKESGANALVEIEGESYEIPRFDSFRRVSPEEIAAADPGDVNLDDVDLEPILPRTDTENTSQASASRQGSQRRSGNSKVKQIQKIIGATPDGIWGPETNEKLLEYTKAYVPGRAGARSPVLVSPSMAPDSLWKNWKENAPKVEKITVNRKNMTFGPGPDAGNPTMKGNLTDLLKVLEFIRDARDESLNESLSHGALIRRRYRRY